MQNYTTEQIQSLALLLLFGIYFIFKIVNMRKFFKPKTLLKRNQTLKKLKKLSWEDFERLSMELFSKMGWEVEGNEKKGADGGVDIWMRKSVFLHPNISAIVQCKRYEDAKVTIKVVREMYGLMHEYKVDEVYIVTTSEFTKECYLFIEDKEITLINGTELVRLITRHS